MSSAHVFDININLLAEVCHAENVHFWKDLETNEDVRTRPHVVGEKLMLIVCEISEAMEAHRKDLMDTHLPHRKGIEVELADAFIRLCDLAAALHLDLEGAVIEKLLYNRTRLDHTREARLAANGKKC